MCDLRMPVKDLSGPFSLVLVDAIGPLPATDSDNKHILLFAIQAPDLIPFVSMIIDAVICRHGVPEELLSDRVTNFTSVFACSLYHTLVIKCSHHPLTQQLVERFNDVYFPRVLFVYRTPCYKSLGATPFFSLYGRDPKFTLVLVFSYTTKD
ncbi:Gag-pol fusion protein [Phytophthora megakarya]|uniref:Gag-pol fusion protein n=1 Tax=Phytophthora megakarya TaxID=4795 RepID=A0A225V5M9_9STRA|nr:Gag-pol fusion protein [Phytophthora megakarya]